MTGSEESGSTRPISVAELLARNGNIGSPPVTGRRRRHRGHADAVTVAELTGEIPIIRDNDHDDHDEAPPAPRAEAPVPAVDEHPEAAPAAPQPAVGDRRSLYPSAPANRATSGDVAAEQMSPDFVVGDDPAVDDDEDALDLEGVTPPKVAAPVDDGDRGPSYLRSTAGPLFGGQTFADDVARRGGQPDEAPELLLSGRADEDGTEAHEPLSAMSKFLRGAWIVGQSILAVAFGAGLFIGFDQLWKWNNIVALVLSVLVILGLVVGVRVLRKTEDIASTLIAVAVGALVTLGPLALLQSN
jgi:hypothetical protein